MDRTWPGDQEQGAQADALEEELREALRDWRAAAYPVNETGYEAFFAVVILACIAATVIAFLIGVPLGILALLGSLVIVIGILMFSDFLLAFTGRVKFEEIEQKRKRVQQLEAELHRARQAQSSSRPTEN